MRFAQYGDVVEAFPTDRADEPLYMTVLPWRAWRDRSVPDAHGPRPPGDDGAVGAVSITNEVSRGLSPDKVSVPEAQEHEPV